MTNFNQTKFNSPISHNPKIREVLDNFIPQFAPNSYILYINGIKAEQGYFDKTALESLDLFLDSPDKFPDILLYNPDKNWLLLIDILISHGPMTAKRHEELSQLFSKSSAELVFLNVFPDRHKMAEHLTEISWKTNVWVADAPTHLIHFDGEKFLGPYA